MFCDDMPWGALRKRVLPVRAATEGVAAQKRHRWALTIRALSPFI